MSPSKTLTTPERTAAAIVGVLLGVLAYLALAHPPNVSKVAPDKACTTTKCIVDVAADTSTLVTALALLAGAALLIALLGVRFTKVSAGQISLEATVTDVTQEPLGTNGEAASPRGEALAPEPADPNAWESLPDWARTALRRWADDSEIVTSPLRRAVTAASKPAGKGNRTWDVKVRADSGNIHKLRVATGKGSASATEEPSD